MSGHMVPTIVVFSGLTQICYILVRWFIILGRAWANSKLLITNLAHSRICHCLLMPRPHLAHARRRGLVSQVQILGLAPKAWSSQSDRRRAFIRIMQKHRSKWCYDIHFSHWQICNPTLTITRLGTFAGPRIWTCDTRPTPSPRVC